MPSYICDSVILPFEKFGYELIYYDVDKYFNPAQVNVDSIEIGIFLHIGYFGFPTNEILSDIISKLRAKSVIIVEDVTQTIFSNYENRIYNDFVVGSIRKWFGIPSGGFLASDKNISIELPYPPDDFIDLRISSLQQKYEYIRTQDKSLKDGYLEGFKKAEQLLDKDVNSYRIDKMSESIIKCLDVKRLERTRRENFEFLLRHLKKISEVEVVFRNINYGVTPMFFPIYVNNDRDYLRNGLISKEIYCPIHWPVPNKLKGLLSSEMKNIYDSILSIPCDQRYGIDDMKRIVDTIKELV